MSDITKLPKWAQEHIVDLQRQANASVQALNQWRDQQKTSKFSSCFPICTGESPGPSFKEVYFHPYADGMMVRHAGIELRVSAFEDDSIRLQWTTLNIACGEVAFIPTSFQSATLKHPSKLRK